MPLLELFLDSVPGPDDISLSYFILFEFYEGGGVLNRILCSLMIFLNSA